MKAEWKSVGLVAAVNRDRYLNSARKVDETLASMVCRATFVALLLMLVSGCNPGSETEADADRALIGAPAVGDIYAAELTYFSEASFEDEDKIFGLMKVMAVDEDKVTVVTENAGSESDSVPREEIQGDMEGIEFDASERIELAHPELLKAHETGKIFAVRR